MAKVPLTNMASSNWALSQLSQLLPLDEESIKQVLEYTSTLPKEAAAEHLKDILGDSAKALEFISSFNSRREAPTPAISAADPPKPARKSRQKKPPLNKLPPPRQPEDYGNTAGAYKKKDEDDYMAGSRRSHPETALARTLALSDHPDARQLPISTKSSRPPPSAAGPLISDLPNVHTGSRNTSRTSSPAPKTKINVPGGASMHGASTTLEDLVTTLTPTCKTRANPRLPGLRHPHSRDPNQPLPQQQQLLPHSPPLHLPRNPPPPPSSRAQLPQLR